jgi:nitrite reductase/ring-hydroxylating ferredoxin subunit
VQACEFDVTNGNCLTEPAYRVERFEVHVEGDDILVSEEPAQG